jgi:hypothetical protein
MNEFSATFAPTHADARLDASVEPEGSLEFLSQAEVAELCDHTGTALHELVRRCVLAILNSGSYVDDAKAVFERFHDFDLRLVRESRGIRIDIRNAPAQAFVDGQMIRGTRELLFAVLRDVVYVNNEIARGRRFDLATGAGITDAVFNILRNADALKRRPTRGVVVCWGGHSIRRDEYDYTKEVGYQLGLRGFDVCTGCGPGAMKGPMKGATIGHAKQRIRDGRYIGITEPGIIAAEAPNPIVNELVIMPDMEKRLEAFVRLAHAVVIFPGGVGTAEEILYVVGVLMHPRNAENRLPVILTGPPGSERYFERLVEFVRVALGPQASGLLQTIVGDPTRMAGTLSREIDVVHRERRERHDAYFFNWRMHVDWEFQVPFVTNHQNMAAIRLHPDQAPHERAVSLRRVLTGIVAGNVKDEGIRAVERHGPYEIHGPAAIMGPLDALLADFAAEGRMKLPGAAYAPCYRLVS